MRAVSVAHTVNPPLCAGGEELFSSISQPHSVMEKGQTDLKTKLLCCYISLFCVFFVCCIFFCLVSV